MPLTSMFFGVLLIALGLVGYFAPEHFGEVGEKGSSPTALIPAVFGLLLFVCGAAVSAKPKFRKHVMHLAAIVALLGVAGGFVPLAMRNFNFALASVVSSLLMVILCGLFLILCIRSFVLARVARSEGLPDEPYAEENRAR